ncbi:unnamed protein product [Spirodela intermedia]|uniref:Tubby-like F-box protein n=1 Tax=Spirodela intermedia TaxID=51605 RepID=A0A7I8J698_SPIIN|nr:unnamed protein product [Spirodela intermedia]CAA6665631.1 unnamed protein product [Spirodela intermedia]
MGRKVKRRRRRGKGGEGFGLGSAGGEEDRWSRLLPDLLGEIVRRLESSEDQWPLRKNVVACACVCKRWREITQGIVRPPRESGMITFPSSLKQPGPRDSPLQCFIRRNRKNSTFYLYLGLTQTFMDKGKFLLAARRYRHGAHTEYVISLNADNLSQGSSAYVGKLSSDFLGTKFTICDSQPPFSGAKASSSGVRGCFSSKRISPQVPSGNFEIGQVSYKFNVLKSRGPRRMACTLRRQSTGVDAEKESPSSGADPVVLRNKSPRWHEHLQCWCLNFHGRVTVASVKNFQLVAAADPASLGVPGTMKPSFQAFAISLTSFGTKLACE